MELIRYSYRLVLFQGLAFLYIVLLAVNGADIIC